MPKIIKLNKSAKAKIRKLFCVLAVFTLVFSYWCARPIRFGPVIKPASAAYFKKGDTGGWGWAEKFGFISMDEAGGSVDYGVTVGEAALTGYAWSEKTGWIDFNDSGSTYGVLNDGNGNLSGHAWSEKLGYISFDDPSANDYYQVTISGHNFAGYAWSELGGYISMSEVVVKIDYIIEGEIQFEGDVKFD